MAEYQVGINVFRRTPGQEIDVQPNSAILASLDALLPRPYWSSLENPCWKGKEGFADHDCSMIRSCDDVAYGFHFRIDMRRRQNAEKILNALCRFCADHDLVPHSYPDGNMVMKPDFDKLLAFFESMVRVRVLALTGCIDSDFAAPIEFTNRTYAEYQSDLEELWVDPVGGSSISIRMEPANDSRYRAWLRFQSSESNVDRIVEQLSPNQTPHWNANRVQLTPQISHPSWWTPRYEADCKTTRFPYPRDLIDRQRDWMVCMIHYELESKWCFVLLCETKG